MSSGTYEDIAIYSRQGELLEGEGHYQEIYDLIGER
jgi:hypothetical protein